MLNCAKAMWSCCAQEEDQVSRSLPSAPPLAALGMTHNGSSFPSDAITGSLQENASVDIRH